MSQSDSGDDPLLLVGAGSGRPLKRRRVSPRSPEFVESSDAEEREEDAARRPGYWDSPNPQIGRRASWAPRTTPSRLATPQKSKPTSSGSRNTSTVVLYTKTYDPVTVMNTKDDVSLPAPLPVVENGHHIPGDPSCTSSSFPPPETTTIRPIELPPMHRPEQDNPLSPPSPINADPLGEFGFGPIFFEEQRESTPEPIPNSPIPGLSPQNSDVNRIFSDSEPPLRPLTSSPSSQPPAPNFLSSAFRQFGSTQSSPNGSAQLSSPARPPNASPMQQADDRRSAMDPDPGNPLMHAPARALRPRTAIQQNPFTMERKQYRALMVGHGAKDAVVKDPRQVRGPHDRNSPVADEETQEWRASQEEESQSLLRSPPSRPIPVAKRPHIPRQPSPPSPPHRPPKKTRFSAVKATSRPDEPSEKPKFNTDAFINAYGGYLSDEDDDLLPGSSHNKTSRAYDSGSHQSNLSAWKSALASPRSSPTTTGVVSANPSSTPTLEFPSQESPSPPPTSRKASRQNRAPVKDISAIELPSPGTTPPGRSRNRSRSDSGSTESDSEDERLRKIDERRRKAAGRVLPAFVLKKLERDAERKRKEAQRAAALRSTRSPSASGDDGAGSGSGSDGQSRAKRTVPIERGRLEIQGDPESSEPEIVDEASPGNQDNNREDFYMSSDDGRGIPPRPGTTRHEVVPSDSSTSESDEDDDGHLERDHIRLWFEEPTSRTKVSSVSNHSMFREGDLVDRMLSRTRHVGAGGPERRRPSSSRRRRQVLGHTGTSTSRKSGGGSKNTTSHRSHMPSSTLPAKRKHASFDAPLTQLKQTKLRYSVSSTTNPTKNRASNSRPSKPKRTNRRRSTVGDSSQPIEISDDDEVRQSDGQPEDDIFDALEPMHAPYTVAPKANQPPRRHTAPEVPTALPSHRRRPRMNDIQRSVARLGRRRAHDDLVDFGLFVPPVGASFAANTYVKRGRLIELVSLLGPGAFPAHQPSSHGHLDSVMSLAEFSEQLPILFDNLHDWARLPDGQGDIDFEEASRFICQYTSWVGEEKARFFDADVLSLAALVEEQTLHLMQRFNQASTVDEAENEVRVLWICWFAVELSLRVWQVKHIREPDSQAGKPLDSTTAASRYLHILMVRLHDFGIDKTGASLEDCTNDHPESAFDSPTVQLWSCAFHLTQALENLPEQSGPFGRSFWNRMARASLGMDAPGPGLSLRGLELSERTWRSIFTMVVISRFTVFGVVLSQPKLEASWPIVVKALSFVRLEADPIADKQQPSALLQKRDSYIRLLLSRCLYLVTRWKWGLRGADSLFKPLATIFRSRKFGNLRGEAVDFPVFIREGKDSAGRDTAFGYFLKLVGHAAKDNEVDGVAGQTKMRKLVSLIFPVGSTPFTKDNPPIGSELSMLFNRFATVIVSVHIEPSQASKRVQQARGFLDFSKAEFNSRTAAVRGLMLIGITHRKLKLDLSEVMLWFAEMIKIALADFKEAEKRAGSLLPAMPGGATETALLVLQLVGALRYVIESHPPGDEKVYPDPIMLKGACLAQIMESSLANDIRTTIEIRKLIQAFLNARTAALPPRYKPVVVQPRSEESQESEDYGDFGLDFEDPALLQMLGEREPTPMEKMDLRTAQIMKDTLSPAIFRLIRKHFGESRTREAIADLRTMEARDNDDKWIECWVGCIDVLVRNNMKEWPQYAEWGEESLDRIVDSSHRREIELRFLLAVLKIDCTAYTRNGEWFLRVWLTSLGSSKYTVEPKYTRELFEADEMAHPLLRDLPPWEGDDALVPSHADLRRLRYRLVRGVMENLHRMMEKPKPTAEERQVVASGRDGLVGLLSTMKAQCEILRERNDEEADAYRAFVASVVGYLRGMPRMLEAESRIANVVGTGDGGRWWSL